MNKITASKHKTIFSCSIVLMLAVSCSYKEAAAFPFYNKDGTETVFFALSKESSNGKFFIESSKKESQKKYSYKLQEAVTIPDNYALEIDYTVQPEGSNYNGVKIAVSIGNGNKWILPLDTDFLNLQTGNSHFCYIIPESNTKIEEINIFAVNNNTDKSGFVFNINSLRINKKLFGFKQETNFGETKIVASPFVYSQTDNNENVLVIDPQKNYFLSGSTELSFTGLGKNARIGIANETFTYIAGLNQDLFFPQEFIPQNSYPLTLRGETDSIILCAAQDNKTDLLLDPWLILNYPKEKWRNKNYEYFKWDVFPSIIIFDTADYAVQDKLFKRLAFFTEKKGFRGRIAPDSEIADLHGWNAHDYNPQTLANFFNEADKINFNLSKEEQELCGILLQAGIIILAPNERAEKYYAGSGALISVSRESAQALRRQLMVHECFHGIFFIDADFRNFSKTRWEKLPSVPKKFIRSFFDYQQYDINDSYLMENEFMAYCLQQPVGAASEYFGKIIARRIEASEWRKSVLPEKDEATESWPELATAFQNEATAFSNYVQKRWGLRAGCVWRVTEYN
jgi:hypothetical protein